MGNTFSPEEAKPRVESSATKNKYFEIHVTQTLSATKSFIVLSFSVAIVSLFSHLSDHSLSSESCPLRPSIIVVSPSGSLYYQSVTSSFQFIH